jgi:DNA-binding protein H-NS
MKNPKSMSVEELISLRNSVDQLIAERVSTETSALRAKLAQLESLGNRKPGRSGRGSSLKGTRVAPKYRNPENSAETWAGRGMMPSWMRALVKQGHKPDEFAIKQSGSSAKRAVKRGRKKKAA